jgi:nicotinamidase-related amidase
MITALLTIDMQNDFVLPGAPGCVAGAMATVPRLREVLDWFRQQRWPVFHMVREYRADGSDIELCRLEAFRTGRKMAVPGTPGCEIVKELAPLPGEYRIVKPRFSGFMGTELDFMLRRLGVEQVVITGTQYPNCIRATAFDSLAYGYRTTILTDATSAVSDDIAQANIRDLQNVGVTCVTLDEFKKDIHGH